MTFCMQRDLRTYPARITRIKLGREAESDGAEDRSRGHLDGAATEGKLPLGEKELEDEHRELDSSKWGGALPTSAPSFKYAVRKSRDEISSSPTRMFGHAPP